MKKIIAVGLGAGDINQLPLGVYRLLKGNLPVYLRTKEHPVVTELENEKFTYQSFDGIYEKYSDFESVYQEIVTQLLNDAKDGPIIYAVPGHPMVAEKTIQLLLNQNDVEIEIAGGQSFLDALFQATRFDPIDGFQLLDGTDFHHSQVQLTQHIMIGQVYDRMVASDVKLELMELLPDSYEVFIVTNAGSSNELIKKVPLYLLDHDWEFSNLTSLYVPPVGNEEILYKNFQYLREIIKTLRGPNGCPWDKEQTHESLKKYLIEEAYELLEAIDQNDDDHIIEELGDVLLQVLLHAQIGEDEGYFSISDVIETLTAKMIRRHPHVFGETQVDNAEDVTRNWQKIKASEKSSSTESQSIFASRHKGLPALLQAYEIQKQAKHVGFDWDKVEDVIAKVREEIEEIEKEVGKINNHASLVKEIGDLLFSVVNLSRHLAVHPEEALVSTNQKFIRRFQFIEERMVTMGKSLSDFTLEQLDYFWEEAKKQGL